jgi:hypothetical protein
VLYIDDLDRCPPRRVVEVLEAIHLMLALELFVVVVAVDARWLIRSLEYHYRELFSTSDRSTPTVSASSPELDADTRPASPVDYLDKIFQIPYVLAPPPPEAMASYLRALLPPPASPAPVPEIPARTPAAGSMPTGAEADVHRREELQATDAEGPFQQEDEPGLQPLPDRSEDSFSPPAEKPSGHGKREQPLAMGTGEAATAIPDLRPLGLQLSQPEVDFMTRLGPLLPTPRAAKKLVNLYRLVRIGIPDSDLATFAGSKAGGQYQVVQILLAVLVGSPAAAQRIFLELIAATPESDILTIFAKTATADSLESHLCARIGAELAKIAEDTPVTTATGEYQRWCSTLARYSFHTRTMTAKQ